MLFNKQFERKEQLTWYKKYSHPFGDITSYHLVAFAEFNDELVRIEQHFPNQKYVQNKEYAEVGSFYVVYGKRTNDLFYRIDWEDALMIVIFQLAGFDLKDVPRELL